MVTVRIADDLRTVVAIGDRTGAIGDAGCHPRWICRFESKIDVDATARVSDTEVGLP